MKQQRREPILSTTEVHALLENAQQGRRWGIQSEPESIDILASDRALQAMIPALSVGYVRLAEDLRKVLTSVLRRKVEVHNEEPEIMTGRGLERVTDKAACMLTMHTTTLGQDCGYSILAIDPILAYSIIERLFGSNAPEPSPPDRNPTSLERRMLSLALAPVLESINRNLEPAQAFRFELAGVECTLDLVSGFTPDVTVLHIPFTTTLGDQLASLSLAFSSQALAPLRPVLCAPLAEPDNKDDNARVMIEQVVATKISVSVELGSSNMRLRDVMDLEVGMVIALDSHPTDELPVQVEGVEKFRGFPVHDDGALAIEITRKTT